MTKSIAIDTNVHEKHEKHEKVHEKKPRKPAKSPFKPRTSFFDYETIEKTQNPMRGFFTLFWMSMVAHTIVTMYKNFKSNGILLSLDFFSRMSKETDELAIADLLMVSSLFVCVILQKVIVAKWIPRSLARLAQHGWQLVWFLAGLKYVFERQSWGWTQSGCFIMHLISMLLKQHSYTAYNIELNFKHDELLKLRHDIGAKKKQDVSIDGQVLDRIGELEAELNKPSVSFPNNVTFYNFFDYLLVPTLVYELEYPRTERFRLWYFIERCFATLASCAIMYLTMEHHVYPILEQIAHQSFLDSVIALLMPFMVMYLLLFYVIFECICNVFAEMTCFADRQFYDDWWNSTSFDEYARKWNKPVHEFLLRHVYVEGIDTYKLSKNDATLLTFFLSSCFHELVMYVIGKKLRLYFFGLQMIQIPLIFMARIPAVRRQKLAGNCLFWFGMFLGPPLLAVTYLREHYVH